MGKTILSVLSHALENPGVWGVWSVLGLAFVLANLPFLLERAPFASRFRFFSSGNKAFGWRFLALVLLYFAIGIYAAVLEWNAYGSVYRQGWEFYVTTFCLFLVFAFPGFVYCALWHNKRRRAEEDVT